MVYKPTPEDFISWHGSPLRATHLDPADHVYIRVNLTGVTSDFQGCKPPTTTAEPLFVTGGNRGIGLALSEGVAKAGANVAIIFKCVPLFLQFLIERPTGSTGRPRTHTKPPKRSPSNTA
jgi:hypothetical protein